MKVYTSQYTALFSFSWAAIYLLYPSWALPISTYERGVLYFGIAACFFVLSMIMNRWFEKLAVETPAIVMPENFTRHLKEHVGLLATCVIAVVLHVGPILSPIYLVGDEGLFLQNGLWVYDRFGSFWHEAVRYVFWIAVVTGVIIYRKRRSSVPVSGRREDGAVSYRQVGAVLFSLSILVIYFALLHDLPYEFTMIRYPPVQNMLYLVSYLTIGINYLGPRLVQLAFYLLCAVYIYKIIILCYSKEAGLIGASFYLFSPIVFSYAHFAELASGVVFFIVIASYYFLRYLLYKENRGLLLASYFIGTGFLYKRDMFLMFFICSAYIVFQKIMRRDSKLIEPLKILSLPLFPIIPWMIMGRFLNWRTSSMSLSEFTSFDKVTAWMLMIPESISWGLFLLVLVSVVYVFVYRRDTIPLYAGLLFTAFYLFYTAQYLGEWIRMSMAFYPSLAIFLAIFLTDVSSKIKWKHSFKLIYSVLVAYMIILCSVPSLSAQLITFRDVKAQYFPSDEAMQWVRDNVRDGEKVLSIRIKADKFYRDKYGINENRIISYWYSLNDFATPEDLEAYYREKEISYIAFAHGPEFLTGGKDRAVLDYLRENRDNIFTELKRFDLEENSIFIYKIGQ